MCEQLKKDVLSYLKPTPNKIHISHRSTFMQEEIHPDGSHRKDGPSTRLRTFDTRLRNYIFTRVMAVSDGCKKWLYKVLHFRDKPMWDLGVTIHSPWNAWSWDVEVEDRDVSPAKRGMGWLRSKCGSIGRKEQSSLCPCLKPPELRFIQPCIISIHFLFHLHWPSQGDISIWRFTRLRWVE